MRYAPSTIQIVFISRLHDSCWRIAHVPRRMLRQPFSDYLAAVRIFKFFVDLQLTKPRGAGYFVIVPKKGRQRETVRPARRLAGVRRAGIGTSLFMPEMLWPTFSQILSGLTSATPQPSRRFGSSRP